jgi:hypothetical protein
VPIDKHRADPFPSKTTPRQSVERSLRPLRLGLGDGETGRRIDPAGAAAGAAQEMFPKGLGEECLKGVLWQVIGSTIKASRYEAIEGIAFRNSDHSGNIRILDTVAHALVD